MSAKIKASISRMLPLLHEAVSRCQGLSVLPKYCAVFMAVFFVAAIALNIIRDFIVPKRWRNYVPIPMAMGVTFFLGVRTSMLKYCICITMLGEMA